DLIVTGVQTCALPIFVGAAVLLAVVGGVAWTLSTPRLYTAQAVVRVPPPPSDGTATGASPNLAEYRPILLNRQNVAKTLAKYQQIGRASCRERVRNPV